jgi:hemerythrin-like domain-containing protein
LDPCLFYRAGSGLHGEDLSDVQIGRPAKNQLEEENETMDISNYMRDEHRLCDEEFAKAEQAVNEGDFKKAFEHFEEFMVDTLKHFDKEEEVLFPAFEAATLSTEGPTYVMKLEHNQVRGLLEQVKDTLDREDRDAFFSAADTLMVLLQQHNMKEEQMLYAMCDQVLSDQAAELVEKMKNH